MRGRVVLVLVDGVGDVSVPSFGDRTPLQVAHTPNMDAIAAAGANGLMDPVEPGLACGSDTSHMALLGYDPRRHYRGRGAFEALGAGLSVEEGDVAFKCNFATLDNKTNVVLRRRADRSFEEEGPVLCAALDGLELDPHRFGGCAVEVRYATEHRCGVVVRRRGRGAAAAAGETGGGDATGDGATRSGNGGGSEAGGDHALSDAITGTDPLRDGLPLLRCEPAAVPGSGGSGGESGGIESGGGDKAAADANLREREEEGRRQRFTCDLVNHVSDRMRAVLESHPVNAARVAEGKPPANVVLLRGAGARLSGLPAFGSLHAAADGADAAADGKTRRRPLRACMVAPTKIIAGVGISFGLDVLTVPGATGDYRSDLAAKAAAVAAAVDPLSSAVAPPPPSPPPSSLSSPPQPSLAAAYDFALLHVKAVDDAGHDRAACLKVRLLEAVDAMVGQLLARLHSAEKEQEARWREEQQQQRKRRAGDGGDDGGAGAEQEDFRCVYAVCVTGDHSTPVVFGDHSHEPVPFAVARVRDAVAAMGGEGQLGLRRGRRERRSGGGGDGGEDENDNDGGGRGSAAAAEATYPPIPMPDAHAEAPPPAAMVRQMRQQEARHAAAERGEAFVVFGGRGGDGGTRAEGSADDGSPPPSSGPWPEAWPSRAEARYDGALRFDEETAGARGGLGRFPGSEAMRLLAPFLEERR